MPKRFWSGVKGLCFRSSMPGRHALRAAHLCGCPDDGGDPAAQHAVAEPFQNRSRSLGA